MIKFSFYFILLTLFLSSCTKSEIEFQKEISLGDFSFRGADASDDFIIISGTSGRVFLLKIGAAEWFDISSNLPDSLDFRDIEILNDSTFLAMSAGTNTLSTVFHTSNKGKSWDLTYQNEFPNAFFNGFDFIDEQNGILISDPIDEYVYILKTTNGGLDWTRIESLSLPKLVEGEFGFAASGSGLKMIDHEKHRVVTGGFSSRLFSTNDAGKTWQIESLKITQGTNSQGAYSIDYFSTDQGIIVGGNWQNDQERGKNIVFLNENMEQLSESAKALKFLSCVKFLSKNNVLATGTAGTAFSIDKGINWNYMEDISGYHTISYSYKNKTGVLAGENGRIRIFELK